MKSCWSDDSSDYKKIGGKINIERVFEKRDKVFPKISKLNFLESAIFSFFHYAALKMSLKMPNIDMNEQESLSQSYIYA